MEYNSKIIVPGVKGGRQRVTKMPKVYFKDSGMRNMALNRFFDWKMREDQGAILENYVYRRLTNLYDRDYVKFWRTTDNNEIDFVINTANKTGFAYEVKTNCRKAKQALKSKFTDIYPDFPLEIISYEVGDGCKWVLKV